MHNPVNLQKFKEQIKKQSLELKKIKTEKEKSLEDLRSLIANNRVEINALKETIKRNEEQLIRRRSLVFEPRKTVSHSSSPDSLNDLPQKIRQENEDILKNKLLIKKYESFLYGDTAADKKGVPPATIIQGLKADLEKHYEKNKKLAMEMEFLLEENRELESKMMMLKEQGIVEAAENRPNTESRIAVTTEFSGGLESFLVTYSDLITLILVIFVLLYSVSNIDHEKFSEAFSSFQENEQRYESQNVWLNKKELEMLKRVRELVKDNVDPESLVRSDVRTVLIRLKSSDLFLPGSAELIPGAEELILDSIKEEMQDGVKQVDVNGHTDDVPIKPNSEFPSNWELSAVRAAHVARVIIDKFKFSGDRMVVTGYGQHRPFKPNNSDLNRGLNRRVDIKILKDVQLEDEKKGFDPAKSPDAKSQLGRNIILPTRPPSAASAQNP
ncbi:MAG: hypothetical protein NPINA01_14190 [Nitrospinaceae bacterium]|nr:MAG: hypothetical protein NPINA01_14190 [Nitrospinaceae bacterium]